jgi:mannose-1-phosphate guanylyltransferase/phosphomannomutase
VEDIEATGVGRVDGTWLQTLCQTLGRVNRVGVCAGETAAAATLADWLVGEVVRQGGKVLQFSLECPVQLSWAARVEELPVSVFVEPVEGRLYLHILDELGLPLEQDWERDLKMGRYPFKPTVKAEGEVPVAYSNRSEREWAQWAAKQATLRGLTLRRLRVAVGTSTAADRGVRAVLAALGCRLERTWRPGLPSFSGSHGGFRLTARDEKGAVLDAGQLLTLVSLIEMENGSGMVALPMWGSAAVNLVAAGHGGKVLRVGRDGSAARVNYASQPWLWSAPSAAARICARMRTSGQSLDQLMQKTPRFSVWKRDVSLACGWGKVLEGLTGERPGERGAAGVRLRAGGGWVYLGPAEGHRGLRVVAEGPDLELAAELCDQYAAQAAQIDESLRQQDIQGESEK